jgi:hypothetical protein
MKSVNSLCASCSHAPVANEGLVQDDRLDPGGVGRREEQADRPTFGDAEERRALASDRVHHRADVVHPILEARGTQDSIGEAVAALVQDHDPCERSETFEELGVARKFVEELDVRNDPGHEDQIPRPVADHLVRDAQVAALRVASLSSVRHRRNLDRKPRRSIGRSQVVNRKLYQVSHRACITGDVTVGMNDNLEVQFGATRPRERNTR